MLNLFGDSYTMLRAYLEFIGTMLAFVFGIICILYPLNDVASWFGMQVNILNGLSVFEFIKLNSSVITPILFISLAGFFIYEVIK